jgi:hypothetical protein
LARLKQKQNGNYYIGLLRKKKKISPNHIINEQMKVQQKTKKFHLISIACPFYDSSPKHVIQKITKMKIQFKPHEMNYSDNQFAITMLL